MVLAGSPHHDRSRGCSALPGGVWCCRTLPWSWGVLPVPSQAGVTNISWFAACLPGAGASFRKADSPQHLPPLPPQLPDKNFPFSHCFNCPHLRKLLREKNGLWAEETWRPRLGIPNGWMMRWDTQPHGTCWGPRCQGCASIRGTQGMSQAASFQQHTGSARLNAARQVCGEARPVQLDFWRGWSQPRQQPLPARCCRLRQSRARRQVTAPSPRGRHSLRMGHAAPAPCSVPTLSPALVEQCPVEIGKEETVPFWRVPLVWGVRALRRWRRAP